MSIGLRNNNFDILRLLCALLVIVSHSYALLNLHGDEPFRKMTHMMILSDIGLCGFFTISGYLILNSLLNSKSIVSYLAKRCLRIFPGLLVCLIVVVGVCSLFYDGQTGYWLQKQTYSFLYNNLGLYTIQYEIPDVFANNPFDTVNGSLWTLAHEFTLYLCIIGLFFIRKRRVLLTILTAIALVLCLIKNTYFANNFSNTVYLGLSVNSFALFAQYFAVGMLMQLRNYWRTNNERWIVISSYLVLVIVGICLSSYLSIYLSEAYPYALCFGIIYLVGRDVLEICEQWNKTNRRHVVRCVYLQFPFATNTDCLASKYKSYTIDLFDNRIGVANSLCVVEVH